MTTDHTQYQSDEDERKTRELSLHQTRPPTTVPGYELTQFLGSGAYGEVWIGVDCSTGRKVAVKFYRDRNRVDWSQLSREVEKLVFLSADRYVVQLLSVGWNADPPYYVMEYIEQGSLEQLLKSAGPRSIGQAVELFREIVIGLNHAHAKGVMHCDLKPANVLLDLDGRPRLADFGQSRLSHEQTPSLGTLFYMSPEQADLEAVPDVQWDVYALGAILYCMLTGRPPHQSDEISKQIQAATNLSDRLRLYRQWITSRDRVNLHRQIRGVDTALAAIVDRCLVARKSQRFANVQEVLSALQSREQARRRRPLLLLGIAGPLLLMIVTAVFGWRGYHRAMQESNQAVIQKVVQNNALSAKYVASTVATEIQRYFRAVDSVARDHTFDQLVARTCDQLQPTLLELADPARSEEQIEPICIRFRQASARQDLQRRVEHLLNDPQLPRVASWFVCDANGTHVAGAFNRPISPTIGRNFAYRTYCHGGKRDLPNHSARPLPHQHVQQTQLSAPLRSAATNTLKIAVSTPLYRSDREHEFLGVLTLTVEVGDFLNFAATETQLAVLLDGRENDFEGVILYHPLFTKVYAETGRLPARFGSYRVALNQAAAKGQEYEDPLSADPLGEAYKRIWIATPADVVMPLQVANESSTAMNTGLIVLIQEDRQAAMRPVAELGKRLLREGVFALIGILIVVVLLWFFVLQVVGETALWGSPSGETTLSGDGSNLTPDSPDTTMLTRNPSSEAS